jgi:DNA-binding transcriptional ArsR family regulator
MSTVMDINAALDAFDALSQRTRLEALRLLVRAGQGGIPAGDVARALDVPHNTMSSHFAVLSAAGLATSERQGRTILYRARYDALRDLIDFLVRDCCQGVLEMGGETDAQKGCSAVQSIGSCGEGDCK